jgi:hypothetical protein
MENIVCKKCGAENDFSAELKGIHNVATCNKCNSFIKNIPYSQPKFYFGKYKDNLISECTDLNYLQWFLENTKPKANIKVATISRIETLKNSNL